MNEPPAPPSALGLEAVSWSPRPDGSLVVQISGRWLRRRPLGTAQPQLVMEREGIRHRFPATPEPPGLTGTAPGTWQMGFTVPGELAPAEGDQLWLALGAGAIPIPLPMQESAAGERAEPAAGGDALLLERRARGSELALDAVRRQALEAQAQVVALREELAGLSQELRLARAGAAERDVARRLAEQRAHAEGRRREELGEELARVRELTAAHIEQDVELVRARERVQELESERERLRRAVDEADRAAHAASAARGRAEAVLRSGIGSARAATLAGEALLAERPVGPPRAAAAAPLPDAPGGALAVERRMVIARSRSRPPAQSSEPAPASVPAPLAADVAPGAPPPSGAPLRSDAPAPALPPDGRLAAVLADVRQEMNLLRSVVARAQAAGSAAEARAEELAERLLAERERARVAWEAIAGLRAELAGLLNPASTPAPPVVAPEPTLPEDPPLLRAERSPPAEAPPPPAVIGPELDPSRLDAARSRLRTVQAAAAAAGGESAPTAAAGSAWLERAFRLLTREDPFTAGRLALALLPTQRLALSGPLHYRLSLTRIGSVDVTVPGGGGAVSTCLGAVPGGNEPAFSLSGDLPSLARRLASGSVRRRFGSELAKVHGDRRAARAMGDWLRQPITLRGIADASVVLEPWLALSLVARMIEPAWTREESFDLAFADPRDGLPPTVLHVRNGDPVMVTQALGRLDDEAMVVTEPDSVLDLLSGRWPAHAELRGPARPLDLVMAWIERAQSG